MRIFEDKTNILFTAIVIAALSTVLPACGGNAIIEKAKADIDLPAADDKDSDGNPDQGEIPSDGLLDFLNMDYPGLEETRKAYAAGDMEAACIALKEYFRHRVNVVNTDIDINNTSVSGSARNIAAQALEYRFYVKNFSEQKNGGQESDIFYCFGNPATGEIDWYAHLNTVPDNEFRTQRHRFQWMEPQAKVYHAEKDERHVRNWIEVYSNWRRTFPYPGRKINQSTEYQWHGLQTAERTRLLIDLILYYYIDSENFAPETFCTFLKSLEEHVEMIRMNWYYKEDHNIYASQLTALLKAAILLPEFRRCREWLEDGTARLARSMDGQFLADGVHVDLDPSYHMGTMANFSSCIRLAEANRTEGFPEGMVTRMERAAEFIMDITYPDYTIDNFNDTRNSSYNGRILKRNLGNYSDMFPDNGHLKWVATEGIQGICPDYLAKEYPDGGYYILRNRWGSSNATMMVLKNNYNFPGTFHCQPDNCTFCIYHHGRILFPDAGVFKYSGDDATDALREKYRATTNHNTLTFNGETIDDNHRLGERLKFDAAEGLVVLSNRHRDDAVHRRAVFFVENRFFVIVDEASGSYSGPVNINFHALSEDGYATQFVREADHCDLYTTFPNGNMLLRSFCESPMAGAEMKTSKFSNRIDEESGDRTGFRMTVNKSSTSAARFITVIYPFDGTSPSGLNISAAFQNGTYNKDGASITVTVNGKQYFLNYTI